MFNELVKFIINKFKPIKKFADLKAEVFDFLQTSDPKLCTIATCDNDKPECAVMGYAVLPDLTIVMSTDDFSRKWKNLKKINKVAINFGWSFTTLNIQYEGLVKLVDQKSPDFKSCEDTYFKSHPEAFEFKGSPTTVYLIVSPTWIRLSDYLVNPPRIIENTISSNVKG